MALGKTVRQLLDEMGSDELTEWAAFYRIDPWGDQRADLRQAIAASAAVNIHMPKGKSVNPEQFMPYVPKREQTAEEMVQAIKQAFKR